MGATIPRRTHTCARRVRKRVERCTLIRLRRTHVELYWNASPLEVSHAPKRAVLSGSVLRGKDVNVRDRESDYNIRICHTSRHRALEWFESALCRTIDRTLDLLDGLRCSSQLPACPC